MPLAAAVQGVTGREICNVTSGNLSSVEWGKKCFFYCPAALDAMPQCNSGQINFFCPLGNRLSFSFVGNAATSEAWLRLALVFVLLGASRPLAVFRGVWSVIVDTINAVIFAWARSHVGIKILKIVFPLVANYNASSPPIRKSFTFNIVAPVFHACPSLILWCMAKAMSAGFMSGLCGALFMPASTTRSSTLTQGISRYIERVTAIANALPVSGSSFQVDGSFYPVRNNKTTKSLIRQVFEVIGCFRGIIGHDISSFVAVSRPRVFPHRSAFVLGFTPVIISYSGVKG